MSPRLFVIQDDGSLAEMNDSAYENEKALQLLLQTYPALLTGDSPERSGARRYVLVKREAGIPGSEGGSDRWAVDHLFLDQEGVPTLVEVKRSTDTRIRREVVGQMLDYAANASAFWSVDVLRGQFEAICTQRGDDPEAVVATLIGEEADPEDFWQNVKTNLEARRLRLLFVADEIPVELQRVIELLNEQMHSMEVLGIQVREFNSADGKVRALGSSLVGNTTTAMRAKAASGSRQRWNETSFLEDLESLVSLDVVAGVRSVVGWARQNADVEWGIGKHGGMTIRFDVGPSHYKPLSLQSGEGKIWVNFGALTEHPGFADPAKRAELRDRLAQIPEVSLPPAEACIDRTRGVPMALLASEKGRSDFLAILDWMRGCLQESQPAI